MKVNSQHFQSIWYDHDKNALSVINQHKLPFEFEVASITSHDAACDAISSMLVRGAPIIGVTGAYGAYFAAGYMRREQLTLDWLVARLDELEAARPTAINLTWAIARQRAIVTNSGASADLLCQLLLEEAQAIEKEELRRCREIGNAGLPVIEKLHNKLGRKLNILTHCNAGWLACVDFGTATAPIYLAHDSGIPVHVWVDETRPRNQGARLTAWELGAHGVEHTIIADNTGGFLMQQGQVDLVIVGTDRTSAKGDVINKIGTYLKALSAYDSGVPFYVAVPSSSVDWEKDYFLGNDRSCVEIEQRDPREISHVEGLIVGPDERDSDTPQTKVTVQITPSGSPCLNIGFDITPARLITGGFITELGVYSADELRACLRNNFSRTEDIEKL